MDFWGWRNRKRILNSMVVLYTLENPININHTPDTGNHDAN